MKTIKCRNRFKDRKNERCGRVVGMLTDLQIDMLPLDPEIGPIYRCPQCPQEQKWFRIYKTKEGKVGFKVLDRIPDDFPPEPEYEEEEICEQVG